MHREVNAYWHHSPMYVYWHYKTYQCIAQNVKYFNQGSNLPDIYLPNHSSAPSITKVCDINNPAHAER